MSERLRQGLQLRNKREKGDRPLKGKDQAERRTLADSQPQGGSQQAHRQPQGAKRIVRQRPKPHPKEKAASPKNNLLTGGRAEQVDLEADLRPGEHKGESQEPPTTRSFSEDHPVKGRQRLQGTSRATDRGTKPQPAEVGQGTQDNPRPAARVVEATLNPNMGQGRTLEGAKDNRTSRTPRGPPGNTP